MAHHCLIHPTLAGFQARELLAVAEHRLDTPAASFALHQGREIGGDAIAHQVLVVAVTVSGHDQPDCAIFGSINRQRRRPYLQVLALLQLHVPRHVPNRLALTALDDMRFWVQRALPGHAQAFQAFGEPARRIVSIAHQ
jgi:hypothetical protein